LSLSRDRSYDVVLSYRLLPHVRRWPELRPFTVFSDGEVERAFAAHAFFPTGARGLEGTASALGLTRALGSPVILRLERRG